MIKRGRLNVPVIGVAKPGWNLDQLRARAYDSLETHARVNAAVFERLCSLLRSSTATARSSLPSRRFVESSAPRSGLPALHPAEAQDAHVHVD